VSPSQEDVDSNLLQLQCQVAPGNINFNSSDAWYFLPLPGEILNSRLKSRHMRSS